MAHTPNTSTPSELCVNAYTATSTLFLFWHWRCLLSSLNYFNPFECARSQNLLSTRFLAFKRINESIYSIELKSSAILHLFLSHIHTQQNFNWSMFVYSGWSQTKFKRKHTHENDRCYCSRYTQKKKTKQIRTEPSAVVNFSIVKFVR